MLPKEHVALIDYDPTPETRTLFAEWVESFPEDVRATVCEKNPFTCYRSTNNARAHYAITSYAIGRLDTDPPLTLQVMHGADSTLPGVIVFGIEPQNITRCGCGKWLLATEEQCALMNEHFEKLEAARALAPKHDDGIKH